MVDDPKAPCIDTLVCNESDRQGTADEEKSEETPITLLPFDGSLHSSSKELDSLSMSEFCSDDDEYDVIDVNQNMDIDQDSNESRLINSSCAGLFCEQGTFLWQMSSSQRGDPTRGTTETLPPRYHEEFQRIRGKRFEQTPPCPWGLVGLYQYFSDLAVDLEWIDQVCKRRDSGDAFIEWEDFIVLYGQARRVPYFIYSYTVAASVLMAVSFVMNGCEFSVTKGNPFFGPSTQVLLDLGALDSSRITAHDEYYRLVSAIFLHAGLIHFVLNIAIIWLVGKAVEVAHGTAMVAFVFFMSGIAGNLVSAVLMPYSITVGASGAIFGLIGTCLVDVFGNWNALMTVSRLRESSRMRFPIKLVLTVLLCETLIDFVVGLTPYVDNFAHLGGFAFGIGLSVPARLPLSRQNIMPSAGGYQKSCCIAWRIISSALVVAVLVTTISILVMNDDLPMVCPKCRYLSCVPFPPWADKKVWDCTFCDTLSAATHFASTSGQGYELDLLCPFGNTVPLFFTGIPESSEISSQLIELCRDHCY